ATFVKTVSCSTIFTAFGFVPGPVPGATPKNPASGVIAYRRPSEPNFIHAMSSPIVSTFQPSSVGISIARLVLPHADGNAPVTYLTFPSGEGHAPGAVLAFRRGGVHFEDKLVLREPALVVRHHRGDAQREALLPQQ